MLWRWRGRFRREGGRRRRERGGGILHVLTRMSRGHDLQLSAQRPAAEDGPEARDSDGFHRCA
eukprot:591878-Hanusia_phi.AAC.5